MTIDIPSLMASIRAGEDTTLELKEGGLPGPQDCSSVVTERVPPPGLPRCLRGMAQHRRAGYRRVGRSR